MVSADRLGSSFTNPKRAVPRLALSSSVTAVHRGSCNMSTKIECPFCQRALRVSHVSGPIACDGCGGQFNPGKLRYRPASLLRRVIGWAIVVIGLFRLLTNITVLLFVGGVGAGKTSDSRNWDIVILVAMTCVVPIVAIAAGLALKRGRMVLDPAPDDVSPMLDV